MSVLCGYKDMQGDHFQNTIVCFMSVKISHCRSWKNYAKVMENHGIRFQESVGNPEGCETAFQG